MHRYMDKVLVDVIEFFNGIKGNPVIFKSLTENFRHSLIFLLVKKIMDRDKMRMKAKVNYQHNNE